MSHQWAQDWVCYVKLEMEQPLPSLFMLKKEKAVCGNFPGGPVVKTLRFQGRGRGFDPGRGTRIPHAAQRGQKVK